jgi:hypothetical protein
MSETLAIASITVLLKNILDNWLIHQSATAGMGNIAVTALPPDRIAIGTEERPQINLYLYRITPNTRYHFTALSTEKPHTNKAPLALDLHYLLTTYGEKDFQAEILLEYALQLLQATPELTAEIIRIALKSNVTDDVLHAALEKLYASIQNKEVEAIKIAPEFLSLEELSKLWSMHQAHARLAVTYKVSMVLIEDRASNEAARDNTAQHR